MLRITELRVPLDQPADALRAAVLARLGLADAELAVAGLLAGSMETGAGVGSRWPGGAAGSAGAARVLV